MKLDFPDNSFDFVTSTSVFEHLHPDDVDSHMYEVRRVLRTGGKYFFSALTPYVRGDQSIYSQDPEQREKHGFHINERTWAELESILKRNGFIGKTDILPYRIVKRIPFFLFLVPLKVKAVLEKSIPINDVTIKVFRLGWVTIVAKKYR